MYNNLFILEFIDDVFIGKVVTLGHGKLGFFEDRDSTKFANPTIYVIVLTYFSAKVENMLISKYYQYEKNRNRFFSEKCIIDDLLTYL